jgi:hypothetical protein
MTLRNYIKHVRRLGLMPFAIAAVIRCPAPNIYRIGVTYEHDGYQPHWRGIYDQKGRLVVAICHDMDLGDAWEWAYAPEYDEKFSSLAFRIVTNYVVYSMTH